MEATKPDTKNNGCPRTLNHEVIQVLDAYQPGWAHYTVDKRSFDFEELGDHEFWVQLYDILWRCAVEANMKEGG
jgi:hypothetical protein